MPETHLLTRADLHRAAHTYDADDQGYRLTLELRARKQVEDPAEEAAA